ncbi:MAG: riboflavin synthase [Calditrichaeota bacterium]|nr:MAG: riboflavin synthase [Calditrichota bacterium]
MFTGLVETIGTIEQITARKNYKILRVKSSIPASELSIGESVSCDGACLTVVSKDTDSFTVEASQETIAKTILRNYKTGTEINLERAVKVGDRLGGHIVSGHVDCTGRIDELRKVGDSIEISVSFDTKYSKFIIDKGSITLNGISLTINQTNQNRLIVNIIPHTDDVTTVHHLSKGDAVNLEFDVVGKYLYKFVQSEKKELTIDKLLESGW